MRKKLLTLLLAVAASIGTMFADLVVQIGSVAYTLDDENLTAVVYGWCPDEGDIIIPESVTFYEKTYCVTSIRERAFENCRGLTSVTIGNSVTSIGNYAFRNCTDLTSVIIGNSVTSIGVWAFESCSSLTSITIPNNVTSIGGGAFDGCSSLPVIDNVRYADTYLIEAVDKSLSSYTIKEGTKWIGTPGFSGCTGLTSIEIPSTVTSIVGAFNGCTGLTSVTIPNTVTRIGGETFSGCTGLTSVAIGNSVTSIWGDAFSGCTGLAKVTLNSSSIVSKEYSSRSNLKNIFGTQVEEYILGESVTSIGNFAFYENINLASVTIGSSVTSIGNYAFYENINLASVTIGSSVTNIGEQAFYNCTNLKKIYNHGQFPANAYSTAFDGVNKFSCTLYVPQNSIDMYKNAAVWRDFYYIEPLESVEAIEDVVDNNEATEEKTKILRNGQVLIQRGEKIYTLQGAEVK